MKIVCLSDTHSKHKQVIMPEGNFDILIHSGDLTPRGNLDEFISVGNWFHDMRDKFKHRIFIAGNHDFSLQWNPNLVLKTWFDDDVIYLQDKTIEIEGLKIHGSPWTPAFRNWAFMDIDYNLAKYWDMIPDDVDILVTHGAPFSILDKNSYGQHCGSRTLYDRIKQLPRLKHHIFGHLHESYGTKVIDDITFYNVSSLNGNYQYQNSPQIIEV